ncbi:phage tail tip protein J-related protein [Vibrio furnissii]|uniref:phage tail tip protein J-related protein n=2 Tax=Vibrio TaxID=662 RepID=UPI001EEB39FF|nr:hypothetical protein [Vibrio furnissii]MCG6233117.1 hypothetical protein [Vibrio furnissii]MCG6258929.1 hypothetical protein [Vibrio furnissii]
MAASVVYGVVALVSAAATAYVSVDARKKAKAAANAIKNSRSSDAQKQMFKNAVAAKQIVMGHPVLSGPMIFACEEGTPNDNGEGEWVHIVVHIAGHVCEDVTHVWLDDAALIREPSADGADLKFRHSNGLGFVYLYLGEHGDRGAPATLRHLPDWNENMVGYNQCFAHVKLKSDPSKWPGGIPNPKFAVRGLKVFDPRTNQIAWTDNPSLLIRWFRNELKQGVALDDAYITSANICDEVVATPEGEEKRYRCNYAFMADQQPRKVLDAIRATCDGMSLRVAGRHALQVGAYYGPGVVTIGEDDILDDISITPDVRRRDRINTVTATYTDPDSNWNEVDMPRVVHDAYFEQDGYDIIEDMDLKAVPSPYQAQRLALINILTVRNAVSIELACNLRATQLLPGSVFKLDFPENKWDGVEFKVEKWKYGNKGVITLVAKQTMASHYTWDESTAIVPSRPGMPQLIDHTQVELVTNLQYITLSDSNTLQAVITWDHRSYGGVTYELTFFQNGSLLRRVTTVDKQYRLQDGFTVGQYEVQVVAINGYEQRSPVASLAFSAAGPVTPIGVDITAGNWNLELKPISAGIVNFDTMYDFVLGFDASTPDEDLEQYQIGRAKVITVNNLKADTVYQIAVREVSRWGFSEWYRTSAQTTFNSDDVWEVIYGDLDKKLNESLDDAKVQMEQRANELAQGQDTALNDLLNEIDDVYRQQGLQQQTIGLAYAERKLLEHADDLSAQASSLLELLAKYNQNFAYINELQNAVADANTALTETQRSLLAKIVEGDQETLARSNEYTRAAVGYCIDADGNITSETNAVACVAVEGNSWIEGPLSEFIRNLQVQNGSGQTASISNLMQVFETVDGNLVARGGMLVNNQGRVTGFINTNDGDSTSLDIIAEHLRIGDQNEAGDFVPTFYIDSNTNKLVFKGHLILDDGDTIKNRDELKGVDGSTIYTEFQFSADGTSWHFPEQTGDRYMRSRIVTNGVAASWGNSTDLKGDDGTNGTDGKDAAERYTWIKYADSAEGSGLSNSSTGKAYIGIAYNKTSPTESTTPADYSWTLIKGSDGRDGTDGTNGLDGKPGTIWGTLRLRDGIFPSDSLASNDFTARYGREPQLDDMLTYVSNDDTTSSVKTFDGSAWVLPGLRLNGNLITPGSVYGNRFVAGSEITSPVIVGGEVRGGSAKFGVNEDIERGYNTVISENGLVETNNLKADGGQVDNLTINENCTVLSTLTAGQIVGDIAKPITVNVTTYQQVQVNRGQTKYIAMLTDLDLGETSWGRIVVIPAGILFDDTEGAGDYLDVIVNGETVYTYDSSNTYRISTSGGSMGYSYVTYARQVYLPPNTSALLTIRKRTNLPSGSGWTYTYSYLAQQGFILWTTKS